ncbi:flagellar hook-associated protein FlgK [Methylovorus menthalis]|uniref:flagellar hook-associated protein FlgK n=1 Tax=Methylovorus menthalis TaxID=1002227 RepID=UPI001E3460BF|nr:flagellar hook-associated protein FlgK [Methylovorus menthalis]MCB4812338.1 flagellar hook-associated protein FlgK [Methylovorus menthalis]
MGSDILNIGKSALNAAQIGISVTGNNIANASSAGYNRQVIAQSASASQNVGFGYLGKGTQISSIERVYSDLLAKQVNISQARSTELSTYSSQISSINNMLADSSAGLSPALQDFFDSIQDLTNNPGSASSRQAMLSSSEALASRFQSLSSRLTEMENSVNSQLSSSTSLVNSYAQQIASLNDSITKAIGATGKSPNDLMDQRDLLVSKMSSQIKTTIVKSGDSYNVFVGNGLPLVVDKESYNLSVVNSPTDSTRLEVAYSGKAGTPIILGENSITGGTLGGLIQFRNHSLDTTKNQLGQIAVSLTETFNAQQKLGLDLNGNAGVNYFNTITPTIKSNGNNTGNAVLAGSFTNASAVTTSDYTLTYNGGTNYSVKRLSDGTTTNFTSMPITIDGVSISVSSGTMSTGDNFLIQPTADAAKQIDVALTSTDQIAAASPLIGAKSSSNTGSGAISNLTVNSAYMGSPFSSALMLTYDSGTGNLNGFPATEAVTVKSSSGATTTYAAGASVPYTAGATYTVAGASFTMGGTPNNGDSFTLTPSTSSSAGNNTNALLLAKLQTASTVSGNKSYEAAFAQLVSQVGNKTSELQVTGAAEATLLAQAQAEMESNSGVNLDEEAANLLRYQQSYQAAAKVMQIASQMFDTLINIR